jgi:4-diphosphocytidyl-2-C-methyl-D-erythritol kinase
LPRTSSRNISFFAPAKINLYLHITAKRDDGYHLIESLVAFANCGDQVSVAPSTKLKLTIEGQFSDDLSPNHDNLVMKAALILAKFAGIKATGDIVLTKNLPIASGIGGGSADAAATLCALKELWDISISTRDLFALAEKLGADVPVCLKGTPSIITGIGNKIIPAPKLPKLWLVLVNPNISVSTAKVFSKYQGKYSPTQPFTVKPQSAEKFANALSNYRNDLTTAAKLVAPSIKEVLEAAEAAENQLLTRLSGSGATCFSLFKTKNAADTAVKQLLTTQPLWWIKAASIHF